MNLPAVGEKPGACEPRSSREAVASPKSELRVHYIDGLRSLAALVVLTGHALQEVFGVYPAPRDFFHLAIFLLTGHYAVVLFIVLSGFSLMIPIIRGQHKALPGGTLGFYRRRARRILPAYWAALLFTLLMIYTLIGHTTGRLFDLALPVGKRTLLTHILLLNDLGPKPVNSFLGNTKISTVYWSIAVESQIYLWFPLLVRLWARLGPFRTTILALLTSTAGWLLTRDHDGGRVDWAGLNVHFYGFFVLGMLAATLVFGPRQAISRWRGWSPVAAVLLAVLLVRHVALSMPGRFPHLGNDVGWLDLNCAAFAFCLLMAGSQGGLLTKALSWRPLARTGEVSYSLYLLHLPLLALLTDYLIIPFQARHGGNAAMLLLLALGIPLSLAVSFVFARVFEDTRRWKWLF